MVSGWREGQAVMDWTVERIEQGNVICENEKREHKRFAAGDLPDGLQEGDVISLKNRIWRREPTETAERRQRIQEKLDKLTR